MVEEDKKNIVFIIPWDTFFYRRLAFGLTNARVTHQRAMMALFHDMMFKEIEVYVDDIIVKSRKERDRIAHLRKLLERLRKYNLKLNPAKYAFRVKSSKLLGFLVSNRGIEIDFISQFISQLTTTCKPIFKLLRKNSSGK